MRPGVFHKIPRIDDSLLAELFGREVLAYRVLEELLSPERAERILSWLERRDPADFPCFYASLRVLIPPIAISCSP
jgi:hypothetical protein